MLAFHNVMVIRCATLMWIDFRASKSLLQHCPGSVVLVRRSLLRALPSESKQRLAVLKCAPSPLEVLHVLFGYIQLAIRIYPACFRDMIFSLGPLTEPAHYEAMFDTECFRWKLHQFVVILDPFDVVITIARAFF